MLPTDTPADQLCRYVGLILHSFAAWSDQNRLNALVTLRAMIVPGAMTNAAAESSSGSSPGQRNLASDPSEDEDDDTSTDGEDSEDSERTNNSVDSVTVVDAAPERATHLPVLAIFLRQLKNSTILANALIGNEHWPLRSSLPHVLSCACNLFHGIYPVHTHRDDMGIIGYREWLRHTGRVSFCHCQISLRKIITGTTTLRARDNTILPHLPDGTPTKSALKLLKLSYSLSTSEGGGTDEKWVLWAPCIEYPGIGFIFPSKDGHAYRTGEALRNNASRQVERSNNLTSYLFPIGNHTFPRKVALLEAYYLWPAQASPERKPPPSTDRKPPPSSDRKKRPSSGKATRKSSSGTSSSKKRKHR